MDKKKELVVLVNEQDEPIGTLEKQTVHTSKTPLHRAFSLFLFNTKKQLLLQQRAGTKKTWPLVWSNSCCGHPMPGEPYERAVRRRTRFELGITLDKVIKAADYRYCFSRDGIMENEICPVFAACYNGSVRPNKAEIESVMWIDWHDWLTEIRLSPDRYSPWCVQETDLLADDDAWKTLIRQLIEKKQMA